MIISDSKELQAMEDPLHPIFADNPNAADMPLGTGELLITDARLVHAAWPNHNDQRHTLLCPGATRSRSLSRQAVGLRRSPPPSETPNKRYGKGLIHRPPSH